MLPLILREDRRRGDEQLNRRCLIAQQQLRIKLFDYRLRDNQQRIRRKRIKKTEN